MSDFIIAALIGVFMIPPIVWVGFTYITQYFSRRKVAKALKGDKP